MNNTTQQNDIQIINNTIKSLSELPANTTIKTIDSLVCNLTKQEQINIIDVLTFRATKLEALILNLQAMQHEPI